MKLTEEQLRRAAKLAQQKDLARLPEADTILESKSESIQSSSSSEDSSAIESNTFLPLGKSLRVGTDISKRKYGFVKWSKIPRQKATSS